MKRIVCVALICAAVATGVAARQKTTPMHPGAGGSPHVRTEWTVAGANISIEYGRPYVKGRTIGKELVPNGFVWRLGADEATTLKSSKALTFGTLTVPAGEHTLWVMPSATGWQLIVNKETGIGGTEYDQSRDLGRVPMKLETLAPPAEQLTIAIDPQPGGGVLRVEFGTAKATVPFIVR